jgi:hypothetical protein
VANNINISFLLSFFFFFWQYWGLNSLSHSTSPILWWVFSRRVRVSRTIYPGWPWTTILLISASWVARITGVSHWCPVNHLIST